MSRHVSKVGVFVRGFAAVGLVVAVAGGLSACNTVRGAGQDVSSVGHDVARGANATQNGVAHATGAARN